MEGGECLVPASKEGQEGCVVPEFSVIVPCFNESDTLEEFHERLTATMRAVGRSYEVVFVDDGSTDRTAAALREIHDRDQRSVCVTLCENSGQWAAFAAGISVARGCHFIFLDADLEVYPEDLPRLFEAFDAGHDLVSGVRLRRRGTQFRRTLSWFGNILLRLLLNVPCRDIGSGIKIISGDVVRMLPMDTYQPFCPLPWLFLARRGIDVPVRHFTRRSGASRWSFAGLLYNYWFGIVVSIQYKYKRVSAFLLWIGSLLLIFGVSLFGTAYFGPVRAIQSSGATLIATAATGVALFLFWLRLRMRRLVGGSAKASFRIREVASHE